MPLPRRFSSADPLRLPPHPQLIGLSWPLWQEFGWEVFKTLGGDQKQRRRYRSLQVLIALLKFSWFFLVGFTMQVRPLYNAPQSALVAPC